jgi:hypothetical protein
MAAGAGCNVMQLVVWSRVQCDAACSVVLSVVWLVVQRVMRCSVQHAIWCSMQSGWWCTLEYGWLLQVCFQTLDPIWEEPIELDFSSDLKNLLSESIIIKVQQLVFN